MGPTYTTRVDLSQQDSRVIVSGVAATSSSVTAVSFLTGPKGDTGATGATGAQGPAGEAGADGVTDHTLLTNIGSNTHAQIDTALIRLANTSGTNTGDQDLSAYATDVDLTTGLASKSDTSHTHDSRYYTETETDTLLSAKANTASLATVATSGSYSDLTGTPDLSVYDDLLTYANLAAFPATGASDKLYMAEDSGTLYRWNGSTYVAVSSVGSTTFADITGSPSDNTALQAEFDLKAASTHNHTLDSLGSVSVGAKAINDLLQWNGTSWTVTTYPTAADVGALPLAGGTLTGNLLFGTNNTYSLGSTTAYAANTYTQRLNLNSTAYIDGPTAGTIALTGTVAMTGNLSITGAYAGGTFINTATAQYANAGFSMRSNAATLGNNAGVQMISQIADVGGTVGEFVINRVNTAGAYQSSLMVINLNNNSTTFYTTLDTNQDIEITAATKGAILRSPNGTRYRITVGDDGALTTTAV